MMQQWHLTLFSAFLSGSLLCLSHSHVPALVWLAILALLSTIARISLRQAFYQGLLCGFLEAFMLLGIIHASFYLWLVLAGFYGLHRLSFCLLAHKIYQQQRPAWLEAGLLASVWTTLEWLQCQVPQSLPTVLGDTQHHSSLLPLAAYLGSYGISFYVVFVSAFMLAYFRKHKTSKKIYPITLCWLFMQHLPYFIATAWTLFHPPLASFKQWHINWLQGGLSVDSYDQAQTADSKNNPSLQTKPWQHYLSLTEDLLPAALTIWPETFAGKLLLNKPPFNTYLQQLTQKIGPLLLGVWHEDDAQLLYNAAWLISEDQHENHTMAYKQRLALGAESHFTPSTKPAILQVHQELLGVLFCLETVPSQYARKLTLQGAKIIVALNDDSRFYQTVVGRMHAQRSILRAVETGRSIVHVSQHGFSYWVNANGQHSPMQESFKAVVLRDTIELYDHLNFYVRYGNQTLFLVISYFLLASFYSKSKTT